MMSFVFCSCSFVYSNIAQPAFVFIVGVRLSTSTNLEIKLWLGKENKIYRDYKKRDPRLHWGSHKAGIV